MTVLEELLVILNADTAPLKDGLDTAVRATDDAGRKLQRSFNGLDIIDRALGRVSQSTILASDSFQDLADSVLRNLERIALKQFVQDPLTDFFGGLAENIFSGILQPRADGGPVTAGHTFLVGENGPELLRMGSQSGFIEPNRSLGGGTVNINVVNNSRAEIQTRETRLADGGRDIEILIDDAVARNLRRPGSRSSKAIRETFGANPVTVGR